MEVTTMITLSHEEVQKNLPYQFICETMSSNRWSTLRRKRLYEAVFTRKEREEIAEIRRLSNSWHLKNGVPESYTLSGMKLALWHKVAEFCALFR